jgi:fumarate reductase subunit D
LTPQPPSQQQPPQQISPVGGGAETVREQDKVQLVLAYLGFLCVIPLLTVKDSPFVQWHAKQGLTLALVGLASMFLGVLGPLAYLNCMLWPGLLVMAVMAMLKAFAGQRWRIPVVADLSEKF